jgi:DNA repair protein RadC
MFKVPEIEITYTPKLKVSQLPIITEPDQAYQILIDRWDKGKIQFVEQFKILLLNNNNRVLGIYNVSSGGISNTAIDPKVVFIAALNTCSTSIILAHNHPSGNLKPSKSDVIQTIKLQKAGYLLDIIVLDHLIITSEGYTSLSKEGYLY